MIADYKRLLYQHFKQHYLHERGLKNYKQRIKKRLNRETGKLITEILSHYFSLKGKKLLEVGSGWGEICVELAKKGAFAIGLEPDKEKIKISRLLTKIEKQKVKFVKAYGEKIPCPDNSFDMVVCSSVLEHVDDISKTISEMVRVVKRGGVIYIYAPNYLVPYERHYRVFYPPLFPKQVVQVYLKLIGRNPNFMGEINYTTPHLIFRELRKYPVEIRNIWPENFRRKLHKSNPLKRLLGFLIAKTKINLAIELLITKK